MTKASLLTVILLFSVSSMASERFLLCQHYSLWLADEAVLYDFASDGSRQRLPSHGLINRTLLNLLVKKEFKRGGVGAAWDIQSYQWLNGMLFSTAIGMGDVRLFFYVSGFGHSQLGLSFTVPTASFHKGLGNGTFCFRLFGRQTVGRVEVTPYGEVKLSNPDGVQCGPELGLRLTYHGLLEFSTHFLWQAPDQDPWTTVTDSPGSRLGMSIGKRFAMSNERWAFVEGFGDLFGTDSEMRFGFRVGVNK